MASLKDVMTYICANQSAQTPISDMRLALLISLADFWAEKGHQPRVTDTDWQWNDDGLDIGAVVDLAKSDEAVVTKRSGGSLFRPRDARLMIVLAPNTPSGAENFVSGEKDLLDIVMARTARMSTDQLQRLTQSMQASLDTPS